MLSHALADWVMAEWPLTARRAARMRRIATGLLEKRPALAGTLLVAALLSTTVLLMHPGYQSSDDPAMAMYAAGVAIRETPDAHLLFMHGWIGWLLSRFYTAWPDIPWYAILLYAVLAVASLALLYALRCRHNTATTLLLFFVLFWLSLGAYARELQFTVVAMYCTAAGWLAATASATATGGPGGALLALIGLLLGASVRSIGFGLASLLCVPLLLHGWEAALRGGRRRLIVIGVTAVFGVVILYGLNVAYYRADREWADFYEYNALRANFNDFHVVRYDARTRPAFDAAGWSRTDYLMIKNWFHADARTFSKDKMRQILDAAGRYGTGEPATRVWRQIVTTFANRYWGSAVVTLALIGAVWGFSRVWPLAATVAVAVGSIVAITLLLKPVPPRVSMAIPGVCAVVGAFLAGPRRPDVPRSGWRRLMFVSIVVAALAYGAYGVLVEVAHANTRYRQQRALEADIVALAPRRGELYVAWAEGFPYRYIDPLTSLRYLRAMQILPLGTELHTPHVAGTMKRFGIDDLYLALASRPNVYLISDDRKNELYADYMREKHALDVVLQPRFQGRTFVVYSVHPR